MPISSGSQPDDREAAEDAAAAQAQRRSPARLDISTAAAAPSDSCDELPAVTVPCPLLRIGVQLDGQPFERGVGAVALVAIGARTSSSPILSPRLLVEHGATHRASAPSRPAKKPSRCARAMRCWLAERVFILRPSRDAVPLRHDFRRVAHDHVDAGIVFRVPTGFGDLSRSIIVIDSTPPPTAASAPFQRSPCAPPGRSACSPELQKRFDRHCRSSHGHAPRAARQRARRCARQVRAAVRSRESRQRSPPHRAPGTLPQRCADRMRRQLVRPGQIERSAARLGKRRARGGDDNGFSHTS